MVCFCFIKVGFIDPLVSWEQAKLQWEVEADPLQQACTTELDWLAQNPLALEQKGFFVNSPVKQRFEEWCVQVKKSERVEMDSSFNVWD